MTVRVLKPQMSLLREEYVLVQAWKKTAAYIRDHNWYSDTLELDRVAANLPDFLRGLANDLTKSHLWTTDPLRIVPAPKAADWEVIGDSRAPVSWQPRSRPDSDATGSRLRPLAHVSLRDQVAATAVMLCLADRVESRQGNPTLDLSVPENRRRVLSYGNRLFCDEVAKGLRHRWGSIKLYRGFFHDYRAFLARPEIAADGPIPKGSRVIVVQSDLRQFYDLVSPRLLSEKLSSLSKSGDDPEFFRFAARLFDWTWDRRDLTTVRLFQQFASNRGLEGIALPQGLVASGFLANVALLDFDDALRAAFYGEISNGVTIRDVCRYVDDLRIVLTAPDDQDYETIQRIIYQWLQRLLDEQAPGLASSEDKTKAAAFKSDQRPLVKQSRKMQRIQAAISGGFDLLAGEEILDAVQGLLRTQRHYAENSVNEHGWSHAPIPDVQDATVARFAAGRFRTTYRSLRPLLDSDEELALLSSSRGPQFEDPLNRGRRSQADLDDDARTFSLGIIQSWIADPSNVRLLRIGLDLWPAVDVLDGILALLRPILDNPELYIYDTLVAWYCLAEILRAGATETGFVRDAERFPAGVDIETYRARLLVEAERLAAIDAEKIPWYLRQQALLFLAVSRSSDAAIQPSVEVTLELENYVRLIRFLGGDYRGLDATEFAINAVIARRSFSHPRQRVQLWTAEISTRQLEKIAERDPSFALEILSSRPNLHGGLSPRVRYDLCLTPRVHRPGFLPMHQLVLDGGRENPLRNELSLLMFAQAFAVSYRADWELLAITPSEVGLKSRSGRSYFAVEEVELSLSRTTSTGSLYSPPLWCRSSDRWRFQLGYLLRFILTGTEDFTAPVAMSTSTAGSYRPMRSHWYQRQYGFFNEQSAFGDDWLPISEFTEQLISALLAWPGSRANDLAPVVAAGRQATIEVIASRIDALEKLWGKSSDLLVLPLKVGRPTATAKLRSFRACVVQTVVPDPDEDFSVQDLTLSNAVIRKRHRRHLTSALAAVRSMLALRATHSGRQQLDLLILPELSVHPDDVRTHLVQFARTHKTIILAGLTYEKLLAGKPLINSALWVIPQWSYARGIHTFVRRQGKQHLAPMETALNVTGTHIEGFRPCQWLVGFDWAAKSKSDRKEPLWLTAAICYDATDLSLASDLRGHSDVFVVPALNQDVSTFDHMSMALHYHMFQLVVVANNGRYGGSSAYAPYKQAWDRQVFHLHGQPQAAIGFLEIEDVEAFKKRGSDELAKPATPKLPKALEWKAPPAGLKPRL